MTTTEVELKLSKQEAIVFFEWLANLDSLDAGVFQHPSEEIVLWKLQGQLETTLVEPCAQNYKEIVADARKSVESGDNK